MVKVLAAVLLFLIACEEVFVSVADDAFIVYRYAANFAKGYGPVFNVGERVEGASSFLHLILVTGYFKIGNDESVLLFAKLFGVVAGLITLFLLIALSRELEMKFPWIALLSMAYLPFTKTLTNGLETSLMTMLVTLSAYLLVKERYNLLAITLFLVALTRPEGLLFVLLATGIMLLRRKPITPLFVTYVLYAIFFAWRFSYYGDFLPNTYYAKQRPLLQASIEGLTYLLVALLPFMPLTILALHRPKLSWPKAIPMLFVLAQFFFVVSTGWDWIGSFRFVAPVAPLLFLSLQMGTSRFSHSFLPIAAVLFVIAVPLVVRDPRDDLKAWREINFATDTRTMIENTEGRWLHLLVTDWLGSRENLVVAYGEVGITPFYSPNNKFIDLHGLTDSTIAKMEVWKNHTGISASWYSPSSPLGAYLLSRQPDYIIDLINGQSPSEVLDGKYRLVRTVPLDPTRIQWSGANALSIWERE